MDKKTCQGQNGKRLMQCGKHCEIKTVETDCGRDTTVFLF